MAGGFLGKQCDREGNEDRLLVLFEGILPWNYLRVVYCFWRQRIYRGPLAFLSSLVLSSVNPYYFQLTEFLFSAYHPETAPVHEIVEGELMD